MTTPPTHPVPPVPLPPPPGQPPVAPPQPVAPRRNTIGVVALIASIVGAVFACIPGALIVGWILLPVGFVLGIVSLFQAASKKPGTWAIILSVIGTIIAVVVFLAVVSNAVDDAFGGTDSAVAVASADATQAEDAEEAGETAAVAEPDAEVAEPEEVEEPAAAVGTRENPAPLGSTVTGTEWEVTITSYEHDATQAVLDANQFNDPPAEGMVYALIGVSATYTGADSSSPLFVSVDYVTATGEVLTDSGTWAVVPEPRFGQTELFAGGVDAGNVVIQVPADGGGVLRVRPGLLADPVFIATS